MNYLVMITLILVCSTTSFAQKIIKGKPLPPVKDTVYIGVSNIVKLEHPFINPMSAETTGGTVRIKGDEIIIHPTHPGKIDVTIKYKDTVVTRTFTSTYLPKPSE